MKNKNIPKDTSFEYGESYQNDQVKKHIDRHNNHWANRVKKAHELVGICNSFHKSTLRENVRILDVGCSIGTIAIELASKGYDVSGVDFDHSAIEIATKLAADEHLNINFFTSDVAELDLGEDELFDIATCFDIFEHLHDDELGAFLSNLKKCLQKDGKLIFYTFPLSHDYVFYSRIITMLPMLLINFLPKKLFERVAKIYAAILDILLFLFTGKTYKDRIKKEAHCNPTNPERLTDILHRAGYEVDLIETGNIYPFQKRISSYFLKHKITHRQMWGIASLKSSA